MRTLTRCCFSSKTENPWENFIPNSTGHLKRKARKCS
ncbi:unnamed protein product [Acanthoscelides obtectus]|uniref:Uncharacterized protein n=1 Tax=Acanthoscelides obtectus TaxID=200917 RepID=A0A9P0P4R9_ACAOB|nr:unnamed protein product [Acanthoscelides obtectus]CAK1673413.1 hypothetical protein AOBTE_LOCUS29328 [Acanthoscelides obtectus]